MLGWGQQDDMTPEQRRAARENARKQMREQKERERRARAESRGNRTGDGEPPRHAR